jgi:LmbE family N-acetylglucosaminyl deacetylase
MIRQTFVLVATFLAATATASAADLGEVAYQQSLKDLENPFRMMCVAAHPDDEDGATLAYYRMLHGVKTIAVIATRGEGGQNEIGPELYNELGVIRTHEMNAAAKIEGAELHFLNLPEFGFSKTAEETFAVWGREVALERMVRVIRETRPHVIITNHGRMNDHGHHQAIGAVVEEAFDAAADAARFPEHQRAGLEAWQVSRLYIRDFRGEEGTVATNISALEPLRGKTIAEIAASALEEHRSQGMAYFINLLLTSRHQTYYQSVKSRPVVAGGNTASISEYGPLFAGLPLDGESAASFHLAGLDRESVRSQLFNWLRAHQDWRDGPPDQRERWQKVNRAAAVAADLRLYARATDTTLVAGQPLVLNVGVEDFESADALLATLSVEARQGLGEIGRHRVEIPLHETRRGDSSFTFTVPDGATVTLPLAPRLFEPDFLKPQLEVRADINCKEGKVELLAPVYVDIAPPLTLEFPDAPYLVRAGASGAVSVDMLVTNNTPGPFSEYVTFEAPDGWQVAPERAPVSLARENEQRIVALTLTPPGPVAAGDYSAAVGITGASNRTTFSVRGVDVAVPEHRMVGVVQSYDTTFVQTLKKLGVPHRSLALADFRPEILDTCTAIIVDIRAYQYRPDLVANNGALLDYVQRGGTLLVMYQKTFDWNEDYAPFPISLSNNRVTREDAPVTLLVPDHPLFTSPNRIGEADWQGWVQERGLYFPESWHENYTALLSVQDPDEQIPPGSCLIATHGDGTYFYTALGWYRQLRELHPGALRCFANMLAL